MTTTWENDAIQFPRLIAELRAVITAVQEADVCASMDLPLQDLYDLFDRADEQWQKIKDQTDASGYHGSRADTTLYRWTDADADAHSGRILTDDELDAVREALGDSSVNEAFGDVVFAVVGYDPLCVCGHGRSVHEPADDPLACGSRDDCMEFAEAE